MSLHVLAILFFLISLFKNFNLSFGIIPSNAQLNSHLILHTEVTPGGAQVTPWDVRDQTRIMYTKALPSGISFQPTY